MVNGEIENNQKKRKNTKVRSFSWIIMDRKACGENIYGRGIRFACCPICSVRLEYVDSFPIGYQLRSQCVYLSHGAASAFAVLVRNIVMFNRAMRGCGSLLFESEANRFDYLSKDLFIVVLSFFRVSQLEIPKYRSLQTCFHNRTGYECFYGNSCREILWYRVSRKLIENWRNNQNLEFWKENSLSILLSNALSVFEFSSLTASRCHIPLGTPIVY